MLYLWVCECSVETLRPQKNHNKRQKLHYYNKRTIQVNDDDDINDTTVHAPYILHPLFAINVYIYEDFFLP